MELERRYDIDWLRIAAVVLLIPFHTARVFNWEEDFYVKNHPTSVVAQRFIDFVGPWHMSFLFLLAGMATWLAFRFRSGGQYAGERVKRLLVPFAFGLVLIVPPQTWLAYRWHGKGDVSYWSYYPKFWTTTTDGTLDGYQGGFTPGHLWFILFLFVFAMIGLPLFLWLRHGGSGKRVLGGFGRLAQVPGLLLLVPGLILVLPWLQTGDDLSGQPPIGFFLIIVLGFMLLGDERIEQVIHRDWRWLLPLGIVASVVYILIEPQTDRAYEPIKFLYEIGVWGMLLGLLGLGYRYLRHGGPAWAYATEAAYPFYILHQTVIVAIAYLVCGSSLPSGLKFTVVAVASFGVSLGLYEVLVRRWGPVRFLFGMKPRKRPAAAAPPAPVPPAEPVEITPAPTTPSI